ncbi:MAG: hypothetical protein ACKVQR_15720 [Aquabacterium sp.]
MTTPPLQLPDGHHRRLREIWRSAGWPCQDLVEVELLAAGLLQRERDADGRETLRVTDAGIALLAQRLARNRAARDAHEALVARVAREMQRAGRIVWRGLSLRAHVAGPDAGPAVDVQPTPGALALDPVDPRGASTAIPSSMQWVIAMPDVFSIRHTTVEDYVEPIVHEIKVRRADLLADLKRPAKGAAYRFMASQCWYVLKAGIGDERDVPSEYGVMRADEAALEVLRPAPRRPMRLPFATWMALARALPEPADDEAQRWLGEAGGDDPAAAPLPPDEASGT